MIEQMLPVRSWPIADPPERQLPVRSGCRANGLLEGRQTKLFHFLEYRPDSCGSLEFRFGRRLICAHAIAPSAQLVAEPFKVDQLLRPRHGWIVSIRSVKRTVDVCVHHWPRYDNEEALFRIGANGSKENRFDFGITAFHFKVVDTNLLILSGSEGNEYKTIDFTTYFTIHLFRYLIKRQYRWLGKVPDCCFDRWMRQNTVCRSRARQQLPQWFAKTPLDCSCSCRYRKTNK
jgi:hypothetical protein